MNQVPSRSSKIQNLLIVFTAAIMTQASSADAGFDYLEKTAPQILKSAGNSDLSRDALMNVIDSTGVRLERENLQVVDGLSVGDAHPTFYKVVAHDNRADFTYIYIEGVPNVGDGRSSYKAYGRQGVRGDTVELGSLQSSKVSFQLLINDKSGEALVEGDVSQRTSIRTSESADADSKRKSVSVEVNEERPLATSEILGHLDSALPWIKKDNPETYQLLKKVHTVNKITPMKD